MCVLLEAVDLLSSEPFQIGVVASLLVFDCAVHAIDFTEDATTDDYDVGFVVAYWLFGRSVALAQGIIFSSELNAGAQVQVSRIGRNSFLRYEANNKIWKVIRNRQRLWNK